MPANKGPYVIVNTCSGQAWGRPDTRKPRQHDTLREARGYRKRSVAVWSRTHGTELSPDESVIMPLARYLVEYGK